MFGGLSHQDVSEEAPGYGWDSSGGPPVLGLIKLGSGSQTSLAARSHSLQFPRYLNFSDPFLSS